MNWMLHLTMLPNLGRLQLSGLSADADSLTLTICITSGAVRRGRWKRGCQSAPALWQDIADRAYPGQDRSAAPSAAVRISCLRLHLPE